MVANNTFLSDDVTNPWPGCCPEAVQHATIARRQLMRPLPAYGDVNHGRTTTASSCVSSAQFRFARSGSPRATRSACRTPGRIGSRPTEYLNAPTPDPTRMISDLRRAAAGCRSAAIYELPFGNGKPIGTDASVVAEAIIGGWQNQGVYTYQAGFPIAFGTDGFYNGTDPVNGSGHRARPESTSSGFNTTSSRRS